MKKFLLISLLCLFTFEVTLAQKTITVKNTKDLLKAIGSNRTIILENGSYDFSELSNEYGEFFGYQDVYDGYELWINNVKNLTIKGKNPGRKAELITKPAYGNVIVFNSCDNIKIENIEAGHGAVRGSCVGGVFKFSKSNNITINNSLLYGSGIEGITTSSVNGLTCTNTVIRGCTYGVMTLEDTENVLFDGCEMYENKEYELFNFNNCSKVKFRNTVISHNYTIMESYGDYALFSFNGGSSPIELENCVIKYNSCNYLSKRGSMVKMKNCERRGNFYSKGMYKED